MSSYFDRASAEQALVATRRDSLDECRSQRGHQQDSNSLLQETCASNQLDDAFLQRVFELADINPMPLRHHDQECLETRVAHRPDVFLDLANHPSLAPIQEFELAAKISDGAHFLDKITSIRRRSPAEPTHMSRQLARIVAFV